MADEQRFFEARDFPALKNDLILRTARGEHCERVPVWAMRQAGRYLPGYNQFKEKIGGDFFTMVQTPEYACEITLQPIRRFDLDAAIIFSDILVIPQVLGMTVEMVPGKGPHFPQPLESPKDLECLNTSPDVRKDLSYVFRAITFTRHKLEGKVPLIGFSGGPWTLMAYMIEGGGSSTFNKAKKWLYCHISESMTLLQSLTSTIIEYLIAQVEAGAQMLQLFESHAGVLSQSQFELFLLPYLSMIASQVKERLGEAAVPMTIFAKGAHYAIQELSNTEFDVISLDWTMSPQAARLMTPNTCLQGNLDPCNLYATKEEIESETKSMLRAFGTQGYIANLGHGMLPDHNPDHLDCFIRTVHSYSEHLNALHK